MDYSKKILDIRKQTEEFCREKRFDQNNMITWVLFCELIDAMKQTPAEPEAPSIEAPKPKTRRKKDNATTSEKSDDCII